MDTEKVKRPFLVKLSKCACRMDHRKFCFTKELVSESLQVSGLVLSILGSVPACSPSELCIWPLETQEFISCKANALSYMLLLPKLFSESFLVLEIVAVKL